MLFASVNTNGYSETMSAPCSILERLVYHFKQKVFLNVYVLLELLLSDVCNYGEPHWR